MDGGLRIEEAIFEYELLGFVDMDNHNHFIMKVKKDLLDLVMFNIKIYYEIVSQYHGSSHQPFQELVSQFRQK